MSGGGGPLSTREQAEARFASYRDAAAGPSGAAPRLNYRTLAGTLQTSGVQLGNYDRAVINRLAHLFGPVDFAVINSLVQRAAGSASGEPPP